jgi:predicted TIM-barrel fold metal-dependent hydrolase
MELADFLDPFIEESQSGRLKRWTMDALAPTLATAQERAEARRNDPEKSALADERLMSDKGWMAIGGFDPIERRHALDLLGFDAQLVFATFATAMFAGRDQDRLYAGSLAQNRAVAHFCSSDPRLLAVGYVPLVDPQRAVATVTEAIELGCAAIMVPSTAAGDRSPSHPDLDGFWSTLQEADVPFVLHVGGGGRLLDPAFHNNAMPVSDHLGGGENIRSKDYLAIHHSPELFLGTLILDGVFDRFPRLRGGCMEQGAGWVVSWLHHLDYAQRAFRRTEEPLTRLEMLPSDYVKKHLKFTPFPGEPVGWMIDQAGADLFMFSSDYPHPEGGKDPLAKFEETLTTTEDADKTKFYASNLADLLGSRVPEL